MYAVSQRHGIIAGAYNDAWVRRRFSVQTGKITPIKHHHYSTQRGRKGNDRVVCDTLDRLASLVRGEIDREYGK